MPCPLGLLCQSTGTCPNGIAGARCFYRLEDWWTYELCYKKHVRQFHREKDVLTAEYLLGVYHEDSADIDTLQVNAATPLLAALSFLKSIRPHKQKQTCTWEDMC